MHYIILLWFIDIGMTTVSIWGGIPTTIHFGVIQDPHIRLLPQNSPKTVGTVLEKYDDQLWGAGIAYFQTCRPQ